MVVERIDHSLERVLVIGNYLPRRCGIATFTADLCDNLAEAAPDTSCHAVAMNDTPRGYAYPARVCFEIDVNRREQYDIAADFINLRYPDVVCVQHEYGIFGGNAGRYLIPMLRPLRSPIITTLHTVLKDPDDSQRQIIEELAKLSDRLVVMSHRAEAFLQEVYGIPQHQIAFIHHGIPDLPFVDPNYFKDLFQAEGRRVLLTFGLLGPSKGIEHAIEALPSVVKEFPDALYIILGATHPHVQQDQGERYRNQLVHRVRELGLTDNVMFVNRFVSTSELTDHLGAADVYLTPYLDQAQITSGTLAYAMGAGKAVISTPYWYAEEMLAEGRGRLAPFRNSEALGAELIGLFQDESARHAMRKRAYNFGRSMVWPEVARQYLKLFEEVRRERSDTPKSISALSARKYRFEGLPELNPKHLITLTDSTGVIQHAKFSVPDPRHGYSTDDQARALIVAVKGANLLPELADWDLWASRYLSYLTYAFDEDSQRFGNFLSYQHTWTKPMATEDVHARAVWALAHVVAFSPNRGHCAMAGHLLEQAMPPTLSFSSPRAWAFVILGIQTYLRRYSGATLFRREREVLAKRLNGQREANASDDWPWPEDCLTYDNARIPQALIEAGQWLQDSQMVDRGMKSLGWLEDVQTAELGHFAPVGSNGWYPRHGSKARFDQQPIEAYGMIDASLAAYRVTGDQRWLRAARRAFEWFLGRNDLSLPLYDYVSGACHDGLHADRVNQNQGAESTICWLLSLLLMYELQDEVSLHAQENEPTRDKT
jgi:glycosyltransferase involved in cell wall biosynthesis